MSKKIYVILTDTRSGGTLINVDMKKQDSVVVTSAAVNRILITCNSQQIEISGKQISDDTIKPIPVEGIQTDPSNLILSQFYGYNSAYQTVNILQPGYGYWVKVNESGKLTLISTDKGATNATGKSVCHSDNCELIRCKLQN